jgi:diacylglycerol O-acyltransferase
MSKTIPPLDLMFLLTETPDSPKHVGALLKFRLPKRGGAGTAARIAEAYRRAAPVAPFNYVPDLSLKGLPRWKSVDALDMDYHVSHTVLPPGSGDERLHALVAGLHETVLDRNRPLFRVHIIEGASGDTFAIYLKIHHAIVDGKSAVMRIVASLSETARGRRIVPFYAVELAAKPPRAPKDLLAIANALQRQVRRQTGALTDLYVGVVRKGLGALLSRSASSTLPFTAPRTPMNAPIRTPRSFATLSLPLAEMRAVGKAFGGTLNDVAATVVDAGFHAYLDEMGHAAKRPLVALCPLSLRAPGDTEATTKATVMFVPLGAPAASPRERIEQVVAALRSAKEEARAMSTDAAMLYGISAFGLGELTGSTPLGAIARPAGNFVLSNVPGLEKPLHVDGALLTGMYPVSALGAGIGTNVTLLSYAGSMDFGIVGNGQSMPRLDRLAHHTQVAFDDLQKAAAASIKRASPGRTRSAACAATTA